MAGPGSADTLLLKPLRGGRIEKPLVGLVGLIAAIVVGLTLRLVGTSNASQTHWDEACYWLSGARSLHQELPLHAPPGYPFLISLVNQIGGGVWYPAGALVSAVFGTATIPLLFLIGRRVGGTGFGLAAAWALALSDLHVAYSRVGLTDATFGFWFVLAIYFLERVLDHNRAIDTVAAALATAAAWNVKYNGWMPIPIAISAILAEAIRSWGCRLRRLGPTDASSNDEAPEPPLSRRHPERVGPRGTARRASVAIKLALAGIAAVLLFLPWYYYVESNSAGGYAKVVRHHAIFAGGARAWWKHASHLARALPAFRHVGWLITLGAALGAIGWLVACRVSGERKRGAAAEPLPRPRHNRALRAVFGALGLVALLGAGADSFWLLAGGPASLACLIWGNRRDLLLAAWFGSFFVLVPGYSPYVRLLVPAVPAAILVTLRALVLSASTSAAEARSKKTPTLAKAWLGVGAAALALCLACGRWDLDEVRGLWGRWTSTQSYRAFAPFVDDHTQPGSLVVCITQPTIWSDSSVDYRVPENSPLLSGVVASRASYLAVDFTVHMHHTDVRPYLDQMIPTMTFVGSVANDLSIPALLNLLSPEAFWAKMGVSPPMSSQPGLPTPLAQPADDRIVLYRLDGFAGADPGLRAAYRAVLRSGTVYYTGTSP